MIEFISRQDVFAKNQILARAVYEFQKSSFDLEEDGYCEGEEVFLELSDEEPTVLTAEQAKQLNDDFFDYCEALSDDFEPEHEPETVSYVGNVIAELRASDFSGFCRDVGPCLNQLCQQMGWQHLLMIPVFRAAYLGQDNDYAPVQKARSGLIEMGLDKTYSSGIVLEGGDLSRFFSLLFWIVRCNGEAPYFYFAAEGSAILGTLCKYGNIHFDCYAHEDLSKFHDRLRRAGFVLSEDGICEERFADEGAIEGRKITV